MTSSKVTLALPQYARSLYYAALVGAAAAIVAWRDPSIVGWAYHALLSCDWGNAVAALVAVGGYLLEHWISRRASQLEKQMERVEAQSHDFLVPLTMHFHGLWQGSVLSFVDRHVGDFISKNEYAEEMVGYQTTLDALLAAAANSSVLEVPTTLAHPITLAMSYEVMFDDGKQKPRVTTKRELPLYLHRAINECDRESKLWKSYEAFIRHSFVPAVERIAEIINESGHLMEPVSPSKLEEIFGTKGSGYGEKWTIAPRMWFYSRFLAYARSWQELLSMWDDGMKDDIRPNVDFPIGMLFFNVEAQSAVGQVEQQLIGASQMHGHQR